MVSGIQGEGENPSRIASVVLSAGAFEVSRATVERRVAADCSDRESCEIGRRDHLGINYFFSPMANPRHAAAMAARSWGAMSVSFFVSAITLRNSGVAI